jgi:hypothetical protein
VVAYSTFELTNMAGVVGADTGYRLGDGHDGGLGLGRRIARGVGAHQARLRSEYRDAFQVRFFRLAHSDRNGCEFRLFSML